jgi:hypothetical protein
MPESCPETDGVVSAQQRSGYLCPCDPTIGAESLAHTEKEQSFDAGEERLPYLLSFSASESVGHANGQSQPAWPRIRKVCPQKIQLPTRSPMRAYDVISAAPPTTDVVAGSASQCQFWCACGFAP